MEDAPSRSAYRLSALERMVAQLRRGDAEMSRRTFNEWELSGFVQHFELAAELGWKLLRDHLREAEAEADGGPKAVVRAAFAAGLVADGQGWMDLVKARNETARIYDQAKLQPWIERIRTEFLPLLQALLSSTSSASAP